LEQQADKANLTLVIFAKVVELLLNSLLPSLPFLLDDGSGLVGGNDRHGVGDGQSVSFYYSVHKAS